MKVLDRFYKKGAFFLIPFFIISFTVMALDKHCGGYSPSCPICHAKVSFHGVQQDTIVLPFCPEVAYLHFLKNFTAIAIPVALLFQNRAPPVFSLG